MPGYNRKALMKNYIVITGGAGFVGSNLIEKLLKNSKKKIISIDNYSSGKKKSYKKQRVKYLNGNTINIEKLLNSYRKKIHSLFHFGEFADLSKFCKF